MARTILGVFEVDVPDVDAAEVMKTPLFQKIESRRKFRSKEWMKHIGYTRSRRVEPQPLGETEEEAARRQAEIDRLRRDD